MTKVITPKHSKKCAHKGQRTSEYRRADIRCSHTYALLK